MTRRVLLLLVFFGVSACASVESLRDRPLTEGDAQVFEFDQTTVIAAARQALDEQHFVVQDAFASDTGEFVILAEKTEVIPGSGANGMPTNNSAVLRAVFTPDGERTSVRVISDVRNAMFAGMTTRRTYAPALFASMRLELMGRGTAE